MQNKSHAVRKKKEKQQQQQQQQQPKENTHVPLSSSYSAPKEKHRRRSDAASINHQRSSKADLLASHNNKAILYVLVNENFPLPKPTSRRKQKALQKEKSRHNHNNHHHHHRYSFHSWTENLQQREAAAEAEWARMESLVYSNATGVCSTVVCVPAASSAHTRSFRSPPRANTRDHRWALEGETGDRRWPDRVRARGRAQGSRAGTGDGETVLPTVSR